MRLLDKWVLLYEEYRAFEAEDQVREGYQNNKGFALMDGKHQLKNDVFTNYDPLNAVSLRQWFKDNKNYWQEYVIEQNLPNYPPPYTAPPDVYQQTAPSNH